MSNFTRESAEINTYRDLSVLVQTTKDRERVIREIAMAKHLELITKEQLELLSGMFEFLNPL